MEPLKLNIAVPFRVDGLEAGHPGCLKQFDARHIRRYLEALEKDIKASADGMEDYQVTEIEFTNGSFAHLGTGSLKRILKCISDCYSLHPTVKLSLLATPSALDFFVLSEVRQVGNGHIILEIPALEDSALAAAGFCCDSESIIKALDSSFQNGFTKLRCVVSPLYCNNISILKTTLTEIALRKPEEICFDSACSEEYTAAADAVLSAAGYKADRVPGFWYRDAAPFRRRFPEQVGCGPYAVSVIEGQAVRTTGDFDYYCEHSDDFEALLNHHC